MRQHARGHPRRSRAELQRGLADALARPDLQARMTSLDLQFEGLTGPAAGKRMSDLSDHYSRVIKATGMTAE